MAAYLLFYKNLTKANKWVDDVRFYYTYRSNLIRNRIRYLAPTTCQTPRLGLLEATVLSVQCLWSSKLDPGQGTQIMAFPSLPMAFPFKPI